MLLFLFSFSLNYYLFNCDEHETNVKFNESLIIDKYHQNLLQVNAFLNNEQKKIHKKSVLRSVRDEEIDIANWRRSKAPGIDQTDQNLKAHKKLPAEIHPSPRYDRFDRWQGLLHWSPPGLLGFKVPLPPLVIPQPSSPNPMALFPIKNPGQRSGLPYPGYLLRPKHSKYPRLSPRFLSDYRYQQIYGRPPGPHLSSPSYTPGPTRHKRLPFLYAVNHYLKKNLINPFHPTISPPISDPAVRSKTPPPVTIPSSTIWTSTIGYNAKIWLKEIAPYTPAKKDSPHRIKKTTRVPIANGIFKKNVYWFSTGTANTGQLFNEDEHGFLYVTLPEKDGISDHIPNDPNKNWVSTTAGDVLHGKITVQKPSSPSPKQRYLDLMEQLNEGYMMVFMLELCRMISVKDRRDVGDVLIYTELIYNSLWNKGRLAWIGEPLNTVIWKLSMKMSNRNIDLIRTYAGMMFHMLLQRNQTLSTEVNSIIDDADLFFNDDEGSRLLYSLKQFEDYPKTINNSYWLCNSLIESFLLPFRHLSSTRRCQRLIYSINKVLEERFPRLLREHHKGILAASPKNGSQPKKRKRKRHHLPHKKKRKRKIYHTPYNKNIDGKQFSQVTDNMNLVMRTVTSVTSDQPRFIATARKRYRKIRRPTTAYFNLH